MYAILDLGRSSKIRGFLRNGITKCVIEIIAIAHRILKIDIIIGNKTE